jgi:hypothetical protein
VTREMRAALAAALLLALALLFLTRAFEVPAW